MSFWQALFMGLLQGATELFPVSSLGHAVLVPSLLHWSFRQSDPSFVPFLVLLHLGTASALLVLYRDQWVEIGIGFFKAALRGSITTPTERLSMLLLVGTLPAGVLEPKALIVKKAKGSYAVRFTRGPYFERHRERTENASPANLRDSALYEPAVLRTLMAPAASGLLHASRYASGVLDGRARLGPTGVPFDYLSPGELISVAATVAVAAVLARGYLRSREPRVISWLRAIHTGSANDYAGYAMAGTLAVIAVLSLA